MQRVLTSSKRDFVTMKREGDSIVMTNPRTNAQVTLPKDATPNEIRLARQQLQEQDNSDPLLNQRAGDVMDKLAGAPSKPQDSDPGPLKLAPGVGSPNSPYRLRQEKLWAEWKQRQDDKAARARELGDIDRLAGAVADKLATQKLEPEPEPTADDGTQYLPEGLRGSFEDFKARAEANNGQ